MHVRVTLNGREVVQAQINQRIKDFRAKVGNAVQGAGIDTEAGAKQRCPVDTGRLRSSTKYTKTSDLSCSAGTNVSYGPDVEFGHVTRNPDKYVAARPFLFPAYLDARKNLFIELKALTM